MTKEEELITKSIKSHKHELDNLSYEKVEYKNSKTHVIVTCHNKHDDGTEHGDFKVLPYHLVAGQGCPICRYLKSSSKIRRSVKKVVEEARKIHGDKYDYSLITEYKNDRTKYPIICPTHGVFMQTFNNHIKFRNGCPHCGRIQCDNSRKMSNEEFVEKARLKHGIKYDYSKTDLGNRDEKDRVIITCPKHGDFVQKPSNHLFGQGCPICKESKLEIEIRNFLIENGIDFEEQKRFDWLGKQSLDFYLPTYRIAIECQGKQHFLKEAGWSKSKLESDFDTITNRDNKKRELCKENNVKLLYYSNLNIEYPYHVFRDKNELLESIKN